MIQPLALGTCQVAWVVKDIAAAERFFMEVFGIERFFHIENLRAIDCEGTYRGKTADWVCHLYVAYAGDLQVELIQPVAGASIYSEFLGAHGGEGVQHIASFVDDAEYESAAQRLASAGYALLQSARSPIARVGYFDTRPAIGVMTELVGVTEDGRAFFRSLKKGNF